MSKYDLTRLDSREFEKLCADIIERETGKRVERFTAGKDGGIDGRFWMGTDKSAIIQAKHYPSPQPGRIKLALEAELPKMKKVNPKRYIFMTSGRLTQLIKDKLVTVMDGYIKNPSDIWSLDDIQSFLSQEDNFDIVQKYTQLYIYSGTLLKKILGETIAISLLTGVKDRGEYLLENIKKNSNKFVYTEDYNNALEILDEKNVVVITGEAGIGKTTLSNMLAFMCVKNDYIFYTIRNIKEAEDIVSANTKDNIVFYFDDFLGENFMHISKGDDSSQIVLFMERVRRSKKLKFILNSRTTIINKAHSVFPSLEKGNIKASEYLLQIENLKPIDKARMLYKHMYFSALDLDYLEEIYLERKYWEVIDHTNFNPRIIEYTLDKERVEFAEISSDNYFTYIEGKLDNPSDIWGDYFEKLDKCTKALILLVAFNNGRISESNLRNSFITYCEANGLSANEEFSFEYVIKIAINSLLTRNKVFYSDDEFEYNLFNPSLGDYIIENYFKNNTSEIERLMSALSNVTSLRYLESLKNSKYVTDLELSFIQKKLFSKLHKKKLIEEDWDWFISLIYSESKNLDHEIVMGILSNLTTLDKEKSQNLQLNNFYKLYSILSYFDELETEKYHFLWAYMNSHTGFYDFEDLFKYFNEKQILNNNLLESLAELYEDHILDNIEDHLDIDYTKHVDVIGPDDYEVDSHSIKTEISETIRDNFLDSENESVLKITSFDINSIVERMDDNYEDKAREILEDHAINFDDENRHRDAAIDSKEEINELFRRD